MGILILSILIVPSFFFRITCGKLLWVTTAKGPWRHLIWCLSLLRSLMKATIIMTSLNVYMRGWKRPHFTAIFLLTEKWEAQHKKHKHTFPGPHFAGWYCNHNVPFVFKVSPYSSYLHDAVLLYAMALKEALKDGKDPHNGRDVLKKLRDKNSIRFYGIFVLYIKSNRIHARRKILILTNIRVLYRSLRSSSFRWKWREEHRLFFVWLATTWRHCKICLHSSLWQSYKNNQVRQNILAFWYSWHSVVPFIIIWFFVEQHQGFHQWSGQKGKYQQINQSAALTMNSVNG